VGERRMDGGAGGGAWLGGAELKSDGGMAGWIETTNLC
jgi:hypothetical protein